MTKKKSDQNETEPVNGVDGQLIYPDQHVDAERAAAFAGGKVDSLDPDDEEEK